MSVPSRLERSLPGLIVAGVAGGIAAGLSGAPGARDLFWAATIAISLVPLTASVLRDLLRRETGVDVIALLAMGTALFMGEYLAGAIVALMLAGGNALEAYAARRASAELTDLLARAPQHARRYEDGGLVTVGLSAVVPGDRLLIRPGEVVPVDGIVLSDVAVIDASLLNGEPLPVDYPRGDRVASGTVNAGAPFDIRAVASAEESTYAGVVRLVERAQASKAPFVRLADRYALLFLPATLAMAIGAWLLSGDPVRVLAVLVIATPCPLILAAPVAIISGISRAAGLGIVVKGGASLEALARASTLALDKTGTITTGQPRIAHIHTEGVPEEELLRLTASLDQVSPHVLAESIVREAASRGLVLDFPTDVTEEHGAGITGIVAGRHVSIGRVSYVAGHVLPGWAEELLTRAALQHASLVFIALDRELAGALLLQDEVRTDAAETIEQLRSAGFDRVIVLTGDRRGITEALVERSRGDVATPSGPSPAGGALGVDEVFSELDPAGKVTAICTEKESGPVVMVGDGINDAPALAAADVGVALGARGATASSEAADIVLTVDRLDRVADAVAIAKRSRRIALQSVLLGMALSIGGMGFAAAGYLTPVAGALLQEVIDVAAILNALRALRLPARPTGGRGAPAIRAVRPYDETDTPAILESSKREGAVR